MHPDTPRAINGRHFKGHEKYFPRVVSPTPRHKLFGFEVSSIELPCGLAQLQARCLQHIFPTAFIFYIRGIMLTP